MRIPKPDPIYFLVQRKFPGYKLDRLSQMLPRNGAVEPSLLPDPVLLEEMEQYEEILRSMPQDELMSFYEKELEEHEQEMRVKAAEEEAE